MGTFGGKVLQVANISGGRGRFDGCSNTAQMQLRCRGGEYLVKARYGDNWQIEVRRPNYNQFAQRSFVRVATATILGD